MALENLSTESRGPSQERYQPEQFDPNDALYRGDRTKARPPFSSTYISSPDESTCLSDSESGESCRALESVLGKLCILDLPGKQHAESYLRHLHRRNCRPKTITINFKALELFLSFVKKSGKDGLEEITREDMGAFIEHEQDRGLKPTSVKTRMASVGAFLRFLIEDGIVQPDVLSRRMRIKVPNALPRAMDPEDVRKLLSVVDHTRDRAMVCILVRTGVRIGELLNMKPSDVHLQERRIDIPQAQKNQVGRVVYLSDDSRDALAAWLKNRQEHKPYLFYGQGRTTISYPAVRKRFVRYLERAGLSHKGYTIHCLRHTCATELLNAGMRLECVQQLLGHSSLEMTLRYARLTDKTREEEYFRAMAIIERGDIHEHYQCDSELQAILEEKELLTSHREELHEHP